MRKVAASLLIGVLAVLAAAATPLAPLAAAQTLTLPKSEYVVGEEIVASYAIAFADNTERPLVGIYRIADGARFASERAPSPSEGRVTLRAPADPGAFEVRLILREQVLARQPFRTIVTPVPQGLSVEKQAFVIGESIRVSVSLPPGRYYNYPWAGLFEVGRLAAGGAAIADRRIQWQRVKDGDVVTFTAPSEPGEYELRLYDRDGTRYVIDQVRIRAYVDPTPGALSLPKSTFTVGETIQLTVDLPEGRYLNYPWVGLYDPSEEVPGGAETWRARLGWETISRDGTLSFQAPAVVGRYEFRLYDRADRGYLLDAVPFDVEAPPVPGALAIAKETYVVGEPIALQVTLPPNRYYSYPWVGLFSLEGTAAGGAGIMSSRLAWERVPQSGAMSFTAPNHPGRYEFRLYDRDGDRYILDVVQFDVEVTPTPGAIQVAKDVFETGEPIDVTVSLPGNRYYSYPHLQLLASAASTEEGALLEQWTLERQLIGSAARIRLQAPLHPGMYELRLYDRGSSAYILDRKAIQVVATPASTLIVERQRYRPGELIRVQVRIPEGRYASYPWVGLVQSAHVVPGGALAGERLVRSFSITNDTRRLALEAPGEPGMYELRLHDRNANHYILATATFEVYDPAAPDQPGEVRRMTPLPGSPADGGLPPPVPGTGPRPGVDLGPLGDHGDNAPEPVAWPPQPDPWSMALDDLRALYTQRDADMVENAREANRLAREVNQLDRLLADETLSFPLTQEELERRLDDVQRRIIAAPESALPGLLAERSALERLLQEAADGPVSHEEAAGVRQRLFDEWQQQYNRYRESERARNEALGALVGRQEPLRTNSDDELRSRLAELQDGLDRPDAYGLTEHDLPALRREAEDIRSELARREQARAGLEEAQRRAARVAENEIKPALAVIREDLRRAAKEEDVAVGHVLAGREPLVDAFGNPNPAALVEDSLFAQVAQLPKGAARAQSALNYLETWAEFNDKVAPTLEDSAIMGDSAFEALMFNSRTRADMRVKAAALLAEEAPDMIAMMNRSQAPREIRDLNGERLSRIIAQAYSPGRTITGEDRARSDAQINNYLAQAIASVSASVAENYEAARAIERGETPSEQLAAQARQNGVTPLEQARLNARLNASDLGYLLGAIEAGLIRAGFDEVSRLKAEEEAVKAFTGLLVDVGMAPFPGPGKLLSPRMEPFYDALKSTIRSQVESRLLASGVPATEERLKEEFRANVTRFRDIPTYLLPPESQDTFANELYTLWQQTRIRVSQDPLNQPGR